MYVVICYFIVVIVIYFRNKSAVLMK